MDSLNARIVVTESRVGFDSSVAGNRARLKCMISYYANRPASERGRKLALHRRSAVATKGGAVAQNYPDSGLGAMQIGERGAPRGVGPVGTISWGVGSAVPLRSRLAYVLSAKMRRPNSNEDTVNPVG